MLSPTAGAPETAADVPARMLPVPDGLDGARVDAGVAKMLGFSRSFAAEVAEAGGVSEGGRNLKKTVQIENQQ